jgi:hypothetical protein
MITRHDVAARLTDYLHHRISLEELVGWAENAMMEEAMDEGDLEVVREVVGRIGLANVKEFGLTWEDCETLLSHLGYRVQIQVTEAPQEGEKTL